jgi:hypothetical protein
MQSENWHNFRRVPRLKNESLATFTAIVTVK